jgi:hypothetical protein
MARTETYASAARKPNPVKDKVAQMSGRRVPLKKDSGEHGKISQSSVDPSPLETQKSFSSSSRSSTSIGKDDDVEVEEKVY